MFTTTLLFASLAGSAYAHVAAFAPGMFCRVSPCMRQSLNALLVRPDTNFLSSQGGNNPAVNDQDTNIAVNPLYNLPYSKWWMQADRGCDLAPPPAGEYLILPAGGSFTVELAVNQAFTTLSWGGTRTTTWPDGGNHPDDWHGPDVGEGCLSNNPDQEGGALHTHNETTAAGTAWAISYESDIANVRLDNLVVFTTLEHTPFRRLATYQVPKDLPACPPGGCYCAWLWVPKGCKPSSKTDFLQSSADIPFHKAANRTCTCKTTSAKSPAALQRRSFRHRNHPSIVVMTRASASRVRSR